MFGKDKIKNAVHCTDLPEDGVLEVCTLLNQTYYAFWALGVRFQYLSNHASAIYAGEEKLIQYFSKPRLFSFLGAILFQDFESITSTKKVEK